MKKIFAAFIALFIVSALAVSVFADYPKSESFLYDGAEILSDEAEAEIKSVNDALFVSKGVRVAVCTVDNTGDVPANTYARGVFGDWGVNGVLILVVKSTDFYYAVQSSSISDSLTDEKLSEILNTALEPEFASGNYSSGISATVKAISTFINENVKAPETANNTSTQTETKKSGAGKVILVIVIILAVLIGGGYGLLVYLEKKQERERLLRLEEKRRRLAQSGRGGYYGTPSPNGRGSTVHSYGQYPDRRAPQSGRYNPYSDRAAQPDNERYDQPQQRGGRGSDRFVYPDSTQSIRPAPRQPQGGNMRRGAGSVPPRGQRVDFEREYYRGTSDDEPVDPSATKEFLRR